MECVTEVAEVYRKEFEDTYEGLRQRGQGLQESSTKLIEETQAQFEPTKQEAINALTDTSDLAVAPVKPVVETYAWASVLTFGASIGSFFGAFLFGPFIGLFLGKFGAAFAAYFALPVYAYYYCKKSEAENTADSSVRFGLLGISFGMGVFSGFSLSECYLSAQPFAVFTPLVIAATFPVIAGAVGTSRVNLLAASLSAALGVNLLLGLVSGYFTMPYFFLSLFYVASAGVTLQLLFKNIQTPEQRVHLYQLAIVTSLLVTKAFVFGFFGSSQYVEAPANAEKQ